MADPLASPSSLFFAYPSRPALQAQTLAEAADKLDRDSALQVATWQDLSKGPSRLLFSDIAERLASADLAIFECTALNDNVLLELGYAIACNRRVLILIDSTDRDAPSRYRQFTPLAGIGYKPYVSSDELASRILSERPDLDDAPTIFQREVSPRVQAAPPPNVFYLPRKYGTNYDVQLEASLKEHLPPTFELRPADPVEGVESLSWYASRVISASAIICHLAEKRRLDFEDNNRLAALIAGLALGLRRPLILLAPDEDYEPPFDLEGHLTRYKKRRDIDAAIGRKLPQALEDVSSRDLPKHAGAASLARKLANLSLGEHVAEREASSLHHYFVRTADYVYALEGRTTLLVGRRGAGKTAIMDRAAEGLRASRGRLVVEVAPSTYDVEALVALFERYMGRATRGHLAVAMWRFLLLTEIVRAAFSELKTIEAERAYALSTSQVSFLAEAGSTYSSLIIDSFPVRLERAMDLVNKGLEAASPEELSDKLTEALYKAPIASIRELVRDTLDWKAIVFLVDNLDKAWQPNADLDRLSMFLFALLILLPDLQREFEHKRRPTDSISIDALVFLRSDIFARMRTYAREPDKLPIRYLTWSDPEALLGVVERRFEASNAFEAKGERLWTEVFCDRVRGIPTRQYVVRRVLPRPRDIVYLCNRALEAAVNRGAARVEEEDVLNGEQRYSAHALEAVLVEAGDRRDALETGFFALMAGKGPLFERDEARSMVGDADDEPAGGILELLRDLSVLGVEVSRGLFEFSEADATLRRRTDELARRFEQESGQGGRLLVHPAFCPFLEFPDAAGVTTRVAGSASIFG